ncbi:pyridoxamine 5'-phosphate oxidase family protein [Lentiprolixibacter aurantiacus]|uniref:Pyridoxamine 5'-phosphate oxidase family protein n=1 Tax=Lentiprolixibacter aurantiacus TaxID=2993939 RepID=A0AAE3MNJ8_9FLAO|nr:pyridoxamine 5'-phosphate oxidase family protein [Lentiprolixibacter aurantiacus]MCX2720159.1 pyridoxamine 5'-phosphate oxidase family protein [Lentiprolixibacter aurantiacus]
MGKRIKSLTSSLVDFIKDQHIFFVATAMSGGTINLSPKGMDAFRVISPNKVIWLNLTGSGNETATHLQHTPRMTIMFCAFEGKPLILRLYGQASVFHPRDAKYQEYLSHFPETPGSRQIIEMDIDLVQTSCGMAVPLMEFREDRDLLNDWARNKGESGLQEYLEQKNQISLDGHPTGIFGEKP